MAMKELVDLVEKDLREVVEWEMIRFRDRYPECMKVDSIYINEDFSVGVRAYSEGSSSGGEESPPRGPGLESSTHPNPTPFFTPKPS